MSGLQGENGGSALGASRSGFHVATRGAGDGVGEKRDDGQRDRPPCGGIRYLDLMNSGSLRGGGVEPD